MQAHWKARKEFQTSLPANITKLAGTPANGMVITTNVPTTRNGNGEGWLINHFESTLLGDAAGTSHSRQKIIVYHMQMPKNAVPDNKDKIATLSDTLEIACKGMFDLPQGMTPINITITLTWVFNNKDSGVAKHFQMHPCLRTTASFYLHGQILEVPKTAVRRFASHKLMQFQLMCPVSHLFGMDCNPYNCFMAIVPQWEATLDNHLTLWSDFGQDTAAATKL